jgi:hypothetical protein
MPPLPNPYNPPVPFIRTASGYKCNSCSFCSTVQRVISYHTSTVPGHTTARKTTLQHLFHNRLLFAVQPGRHNEGRGGDKIGVDLYSLYAKQYGLDIEDESTTCIPLDGDEKEMPLMLQILRWHDHLWRYLRNDGESSSSESGETDEEDKLDDKAEKENSNEDNSGGNDDVNTNEFPKYRQTKPHTTTAASDSSESESECTQVGRKRHQRSKRSLVSNRKRRRGLDTRIQSGGNDSDSEDSDIERGHVGRKRIRPHKSLSMQSSKRRRVSEGSDSEIDVDGSGSELDDSNSNYLDPDYSNSDDDDDDDDVSEDEELIGEDIEIMQAGCRISKREQKRWAKWGTVTSVLKAKDLFSIHIAGTSKEDRELWHGDKLRKTVFCFMAKVKVKVINSDIKIRHVLAG